MLNNINVILRVKNNWNHTSWTKVLYIKIKTLLQFKAPTPQKKQNIMNNTKELS